MESEMCHRLKRFFDFYESVCIFKLFSRCNILDGQTNLDFKFEHLAVGEVTGTKLILVVVIIVVVEILIKEEKNKKKTRQVLKL